MVHTYLNGGKEKFVGLGKDMDEDQEVYMQIADEEIEFISSVITEKLLYEFMTEVFGDIVMMAVNTNYGPSGKSDFSRFYEEYFCNYEELQEIIFDFSSEEIRVRVKEFVFNTPKSFMVDCLNISLKENSPAVEIAVNRFQGILRKRMPAFVDMLEFFGWQEKIVNL